MPISKLRSSCKPLFLYTLGDPAGIGPEVLIKAFSKGKYLRSAYHVVIGDVWVLKRYMEVLKMEVPLHLVNKEFFLKDLHAWALNIVNLDNTKGMKFGKPSPLTGRAGFEYLKTAVEIIKAGKGISALITLPLSKEYVELSGIKFKGHTDYLKDAFGVEEVIMLFLTKKFSLLLLTRHIPLKDVPSHINSDLIVKDVKLVVNFYEKIYRVKPKIALLGLNPHAGEGGKIGDEEVRIFIPVIRSLKREGIDIDGPFPADGFFRDLINTDPPYDVILSPYHDQVLPLVKALFPDCVNFTWGLPFLRFSPNHGTAFDIAGKGKADSSSLENAIDYALEFTCR